MKEQNKRHIMGTGSVYPKARSPYWYMQYFLRGSTGKPPKRRVLKKAQKVLRHRLKEVGADQDESQEVRRAPR